MTHLESVVDSPSRPEADRQRSNPVVERSCVAFFNVATYWTHKILKMSSIN